jgi:hypothetical protein
MRKIAVLVALAPVVLGCMIDLSFLNDILEPVLGPERFASGPAETSASTGTMGTAMPLAASPLSAGSAKNDESKYRDVSVYRNNTPEAKAVTFTTKYPARTIKSESELAFIVRELVADAEDDFIRIKRLHDYLALSITYDVQGYLSGNISDQSALAVLKRGTAVCEGYSNVFLRLCELGCIAAKKISGYGRGVGSSPLSVENPKDSNHAWNAVQVYGYWYMIDATWDSGHLDPATLKNVKEYSTAYLFSKPAWFIYDHFPEFSYQQFLEPALSAEEFVELPFLRGEFFDYFEGDFSALSKTMTVSDLAEIRLARKKPVTVNAYMHTAKGGEAPYLFADNEDDVFTLYLAPPQGDYNVQLFCESGKRYESLGEFAIRSTIPQAKAIRGPVLYTTYFSTGARLVSPKFQQIRPGMDLEISIYIPKTSKTALIINSKLIQMEKTGDGVFSKTISVPSTKEIVIAALLGSGSSYTGIVSLPVY